MSVARSALIGGPAKIGFNGATFFSKDDVKFDVVPSVSDVQTSVHGKIDEAVTDAIVKVGFTPDGRWQDLSTWFPSYLTNPTIGGRIFGDADVPLAITSNNGDLFTAIAAALTKPPDIYLGVDKTLFGPCEFTGVVGTGLDMESASSLYTIATAQPYADATFAKTNLRQQKYSAAWAGITGFTSFQAQDGWTISFDVKLEPVKIQSRTVDMKVTALQIMAKCMPQGPTAAQIDTALHYQGTSNPLGHKLGDNVADLVITGTSVSVTLKNAALKSAGFVFGGKPLRNGELAWISTVAFTAGVPAAQGVFA